MDTQNRTNRDPGLENIMESMYSEKHTTKTCEHCKGTGKHDIKTAAGVITKDCDKCKGSGEVVVKWEEDGAKDHVPPHDKDKLKRAKKRGYDSKKEGEVKCSKCGEVHLLSAGCGGPHTEADDDNSLDAWNTKMQGEEQPEEPEDHTAGYIQIDLNTGGVQTISPDEVEQAVRGLEHIPSGQGVSDWDAWRGEEYMIVAVPKNVGWPQTAAYQH